MTKKSPSNEPNLEIEIVDGRWRSIANNAERMMFEICKSAFERVNTDSEYNVTIILADDRMLHELNREYLGKDKPTNVLSFPLDEENGMLGDIYMAYETIEREATEQGKTMQNHALHMILHGFLHLMGYDHLEDVEAEEMEAIEVEILESYGISNPYKAIH